jgi:hypothetical protein
MDPAPALYAIRINGHLGATVLSAFPALVPQRHGAHTVLTGLLDRYASSCPNANHRNQVIAAHLDSR